MLSVVRKPRVVTEQMRANMSAAQRGKVHSPEARAKQRAAKIGRKLTAEHRAKISAATRGMPKSAEHIEKIRLSRISTMLARQYPGKLPRHVVERRRHLREKYGLTEDRFVDMLARQDGRCAICRRDDHASKNWHIDHCHATGRVRGILCFRCNALLGNAMDKIATLRAAISYLETMC